jgi:hypothetical protein
MPAADEFVPHAEMDKYRIDPGGTVSPMRASSRPDPSTSPTRSSGAKAVSDNAVAHPAGPEPAIRRFATIFSDLRPM